MYDRSHVREMLSILLNRLGFGAAFAVQVGSEFITEHEKELNI